MNTTNNDDLVNALAIHISHGATEAAKLNYMVMWTVTKQPRDYPAGFVARKFLIGGGHSDPVSTHDMFVSRGASEADLELIRAVFYRAGMTFLPRSDGDEPQIVGSWI